MRPATTWVMNDGHNGRPRGERGGEMWRERPFHMRSIQIRHHADVIFSPRVVHPNRLPRPPEREHYPSNP